MDHCQCVFIIGQSTKLICILSLVSQINRAHNVSQTSLNSQSLDRHAHVGEWATETGVNRRTAASQPKLAEQVEKRS